MSKLSKYIIAFICFGFTLNAQNIDDEVRQILEDYVAENEEGSVDIELLLEDLYSLYENPINLNTASEEELGQIPFLSPHQTAAILEYRQRYGDFLSHYELQAIYGIDQQTIDRIKPFITLKQVEQDYKKKNYWKHQVLMRTTTIIEEQEGYSRPDSMTHYKGSPYSTLLKYKGSLRKDWKWHITAEQDRGEAWFEHSPSTDFLSSALQYSGEKWLKTAIVGDYRMQFGQGIVVNTNFGYGKSSQVLDIQKQGTSLRSSTSTSEVGFFRGVANHLRLGKWDIYTGLSHRKVDATIDSTLNGEVIRSFPLTGFHRTASEVNKYQAATVSDAILNINYRFNKIHIGATGLAQSLSHQWHATERPDNLHLPQYQQHLNAGIHYKMHHQGIMLFGEAASSNTGGLAAIQGMTVQASSRVGLSLLYRYYSNDYYSPYAQSFGEGSKTNNEEGLYIGLNLKIARGWSLDTYFDYYHFPWKRFGVSQPSSGYDFFVQPNYQVSRSTKMHWRFKYEEKENNYSSDNPLNTLQNSQRLDVRYHISSQINDIVTLQTRVAGVAALNTPKEYGLLIYQDIRLNLLQERLKLNFRYALYNTESYTSRIYTYESDVLYLSSTPAFYGRGARTYLNSSFALSDKLTLYLKTAYSQSYDGRTFGTALDATDKIHKTDIHLQLRIKI